MVRNQEMDLDQGQEEEQNQELIAQLLHQLEQEEERYHRTIEFFQQRTEEEEERHTQVLRDLEHQLIEACNEGSVDTDYWINNTLIPPEPVVRPSLTKEEKEAYKEEIRQRVRQWYKAKYCSKKKK